MTAIDSASVSTLGLVSRPHMFAGPTAPIMCGQSLGVEPASFSSNRFSDKKLIDDPTSSARLYFLFQLAGYLNETVFHPFTEGPYVVSDAP